MSESVGSHFGIGAYGRGPYSRNPLSDAEVTVAGASVITVKTRNWRNVAANIGASPDISVVGEILWTKMQIPPCQPWRMITQGGCYRALANSAGAMFP